MLAVLDLRLHDFLICRDDFVADLHDHLEREVGLIQRDYYRMEIRLVVHELLKLALSARLQIVHVSDSIFECSDERIRGFGRRSGQRLWSRWRWHDPRDVVIDREVAHLPSSSVFEIIAFTTFSAEMFAS